MPCSRARRAPPSRPRRHRHLPGLSGSPANVFVAVSRPAIARRSRRGPDAGGPIRLAVAAPVAIGLGVIGVWLAFARVAGAYPSLNQPWLSLAATRLVDAGQWIEFAANNVRFFNGVTVYHYFSGARPWTLPYDAVAVLAAVAALAGSLLVVAAGSPLDLALGEGRRHRMLSTLSRAAGAAPHAEVGLCLLVPGR